MRLQNLIIIFIVIALPVIMILSVYVEYQVDTAILQSDYSSKFLGATYDTMAAFQLNTTNNKYSTVSDSLIRDVEASINIFSSSFAAALGVSGYSKTDVMAYIPALLFTLYDGYYIYTPVTEIDKATTSFEAIDQTNISEMSLNDKKNMPTIIEHTLKPYVYYTKEYVSKNGRNKITINYSLDNYVAVYYDNKDRGTYESKAGYLEVINDEDGIVKSGDTISYKGIAIAREETLIRNTYNYTLDGKYVKEEATGEDNFWTEVDSQSQQTDRTNAYDYYKEAYEFTDWFNRIIEEAKLSNEDTARLAIDKDNQALPDVGSAFNDEKARVIENIITDNLIQAMENYKSKTTFEFEMPELSASDWEKILHNVCIISFIQGFPVGTTMYNDYVIVSSTESNQFVDEKDIYYIGYNRVVTDGSQEIYSYGAANGDLRYTSNGVYHRIGCPNLDGELIVRI